MKQFLLFVSIAAASLYALLVFTHDPITDGKSERISVPQTKPNHPAPQRLSSWETHGRGASTSQPTVPLPVPQNAAAASDARSVSTALQVEWTKVVMGARMHHQASISLRTIRHYSPGTDLQVLRREGIWLRLSDRVSQEQGWILEKYLSPSNGPGSTQASRELTKAVPIVAPRKSNKWSQSNKRSKAETRAAKQRFAVARWDPIDQVGVLSGGVISGPLCLAPRLAGDEVEANNNQSDVASMRIAAPLIANESV
jgi:hypothetical protein